MIDLNELGDEIRNNISNAGASSPRSQQRAIGPSEVGAPCIRRMGYRLLETEPTNQPDTWLAQIGTWVHAGIASVYEGINATMEQPRYLIEQRVQVTKDLAGSVDLYDKKLKMVLDWKVVGDTSLKKYKKEGPSNQYRVQAHLYGMGLFNEGFDVERVAIVFLPRGGNLRQMHIWSEPFDPIIAMEGIERMRNAKEVIEMAEVRGLEILPTDASLCHYCPYYLPASTQLAVGCPGGN